MTRDKERLAEEVIELKRVNDDVATRLKLAQAEVIRATGELRKRERALEARHEGLVLAASSWASPMAVTGPPDLAEFAPS